MLREVGAEQSQNIRDSAERIVLRAARLAMRDYLDSIREATLAGLATSPALTAALTDPLPDPISRLPAGEVPLLGTSAGRWAAAVDERITDAVADAFTRTYSSFSTQGLSMSSPAVASMEAYINKVRDRLVRGTHFGVTVYEDSFNAVRVALARSTTEGWTRDQLAQRISASLSWENDGAYWRGQKSFVDSKIDSILDAIGPPGHPAREFARLNDPVVQLLRNDRNLAIRHLDAERSIWQTRARLIARTESTAVANYGALAALAAEGVTHKEWVATLDIRTRESHAEANGQVVRIDEEFRVGDEKLAFPGDPSATVGEVANCRCTMVGAKAPVGASTTTVPTPSADPRVIDTDEFVALSKQWASQDIPEAQLRAQRNYGGDLYRMMNDYARGVGREKNTPDVQERLAQMVRDLDSAIAETGLRLEHPTRLFRGTTLPGIEPKVGGVIKDRAFLSTSTQEGMARGYRRQASRFTDEDGWLIDITAPSGTRYIPMGGMSPGFDDLEAEFLLGRNLIMKVIEVDPVNFVMKVEIQP